MRTPATATEDTLYTYNITASDSDGDPVTLTLSGDTCGGALVDNGDSTGTYTFMPTGPVPPASCDVGILASGLVLMMMVILVMMGKVRVLQVVEMSKVLVVVVVM